MIKVKKWSNIAEYIGLMLILAQTANCNKARFNSGPSCNINVA